MTKRYFYNKIYKIGNRLFIAVIFMIIINAGLYVKLLKRELINYLVLHINWAWKKRRSHYGGVQFRFYDETPKTIII